MEKKKWEDIEKIFGKILKRYLGRYGKDIWEDMENKNGKTWIIKMENVEKKNRKIF